MTTALSWVFYYRSLKIGEVFNVALIDKGSVVVALLLSWWLLNEAMTPVHLTGDGLIASALVVIARG